MLEKWALKDSCKKLRTLTEAIRRCCPKSKIILSNQIKVSDAAMPNTGSSTSLGHTTPKSKDYLHPSRAIPPRADKPQHQQHSLIFSKTSHKTISHITPQNSPIAMRHLMIRNHPICG